MPSATQHFENLGAPLRNMRWSWGARRSNGTIILRAWDDEIVPIEGKRHIRLTNHGVYDDTPHPGFRERIRHISEIEQGTAGYVVICTAVKPTPGRRRLKAFNHRTLTQIARVKDYRGDQWAELGDEISVDQLQD